MSQIKVKKHFAELNTKPTTILPTFLTNLSLLLEHFEHLQLPIPNHSDYSAYLQAIKMADNPAVRPSRPDSQLPEYRSWLESLQAKADEGSEQGDVIYINPSVFRYNSSDQRRSWAGYDQDSQDYAYFGQVYRPPGPKGGRKGYLGICIFPNRSYVGNELP